MSAGSKGPLAKWSALLTGWSRSTIGRWLVMLGVFALVAVLFHPLFLLLGGVIGIVTFGVALLGGFVLGPRQGALYGLLTGLLGIPLWAMEYGLVPTESISGPLVNLAIGFLGGSARRLVQRELEQAEALKRTNAALRSAQMELLQAERLALFGEVAAGVAHELNQPLAVIGLAAEIAEQGAAAGQTESVERQLARIREQVQRAGLIIQRLKSTGHASGSEELREQDLNRVVGDVLPQFEPQFQALGIDLIRELDPALPRVPCRGHQVQQVLIYLLLNARDAVQNTPEKQVRVRTWVEPDVACIEVTDTGEGMSEAVRERAFDPFFTTKDVGKGSGLGLPISHRLIRGHGGSIRLESQPGDGTRFLIRLPLTATDVEGAAHPAGVQVRSGEPPAA